MNLGNRIRVRRRALNLTQEDLARRAGVRLNTIGDLERGVSNDPHYSTLSGIARALDTSVAELIGEPATPLAQASPSPETSEEERRCAMALLAMPTSLMTRLGNEYVGRVDSLRDDWAYKRALQANQWISPFLLHCRQIRECLYEERFVAAVKPWFDRVAADEPVPEEMRQQINAFRHAYAVLFENLALRAAAWANHQSERFPNDAELAQLSAELDREPGLGTSPGKHPPTKKRMWADSDKEVSFFTEPDSGRAMFLEMMGQAG